MIGPESGRPGYDGAELDDVIDAAMSGMLAKLEAGFDPAAGLADIYGRCGSPRPARRPGAPVRHAPQVRNADSTGSSRLEEVCDQIDMLSTSLDDLIRSAQQTPFAGSSFLELACDSLRQLRAGLASRTTARSEADRLTGEVQHHLGRADQILRSQHACSLDDIVRDRSRDAALPGYALTGQVQVMREMVTRLYAAAGHGSSLVPAC
jgi:hypothetical protein